MASVRMMRMAGALAVTSLLTTVGVIACGGGDDNPNPTTPVFTVDSGLDATANPDSAPAGNDSGPGLDTGIPDTGPLPDVDVVACTADSGCWNTSASCPPTSPPQFLNQCAPGSTCIPFDNAGRVPGYDGGLPPWQQ